MPNIPCTLLDTKCGTDGNIYKCGGIGSTYSLLTEFMNGCTDASGEPACISSITNVKLQCQVKAFELPQKISNADEILSALWGQGQPNYLVYFEKFPESQSIAWTQYTKEDMFETFILTFATGYTGTEFGAALAKLLSETGAVKKLKVVAGTMSDFTQTVAESSTVMYVRDKSGRIVKMAKDVTCSVALPCKSIKFVASMTYGMAKGAWTITESAYSFPSKAALSASSAAFNTYKSALTLLYKNNLFYAIEKSQLLMKESSLKVTLFKELETDGIIKTMFGYSNVQENGIDIIGIVTKPKLTLQEQEAVIAATATHASDLIFIPGDAERKTALIGKLKDVGKKMPEGSTLRRYADGGIDPDMDALVDELLNVLQANRGLIGSKIPEQAIKDIASEAEQKDILEQYAEYIYRDVGETNRWALIDNPQFKAGLTVAGYATTTAGIANFLHDKAVSDELLKDTYPDAMVLKPGAKGGALPPIQTFPVSSEGMYKNGWFVSHTESDGKNRPFFLASPCKTDVVVKMGECYVYEYAFAYNKEENATHRRGNILTNADDMTNEIMEERTKDSGCITRALGALASVPNEMVKDMSFGSINLNAYAMEDLQKINCQIMDSVNDIAGVDSLHGGLGPYVASSPLGIVKVGCKIPCIQVGATDMKSNYDKDNPDLRYNFCAYSPSGDSVEKFVLGWISMVPVAKIATAGKIMGGSLAIKGAAFGATSYTAATDTIKKIGDKWPGESTSSGGGGTIENLLDMVFGIPGALWDALKAVVNIPEAVSNTYNRCSGGTPVFTIHYYSDPDLKKPMGDNPKLKAGTYYLKIESSQELTNAPEVKIDSEGRVNDVSRDSGGNLNYVPTVKINPDSKDSFVLARTITKDTSAEGNIKEAIIIRESGSTTEATIANFELGPAYIDIE